MSVFTVVIQYNTRHYGESKEIKINECQSLQQQQWPKNITIYIYIYYYLLRQWLS